MVLTKEETTRFYKIWIALIWGINEKHEIVEKFEKPIYRQTLDIQPVSVIRQQLWKNPHWIDSFIRDNDNDDLTESDLKMLQEWREKFIKERFIIMRHLKKYTVLMTTSEPAKLYGIHGISDPMNETIPASLPFMIETVLLPFEGKIIYDSLISPFQVSFGGGVKKSLKEVYNEVKATVGIIDNLSVEPKPITPTKRKSKTPEPTALPIDTKSAKVPKAMANRYMEIAMIIEEFATEKLDDEYQKLCLKALAKLCRKRPSPVVSGRARTWACGIVYAIGQTNYIFDKSQPINMTASDITDWFNLSKGTVNGKAKEVRNLLKLSRSNFEFMLKATIEGNSSIWFLMVNGLFVDIRTMPREAQEQAFHKGLIPYIPDDYVD